MAAVLACGAGPLGERSVLDAWGAAISHRSAAELWELLSKRDGAIDVTVAGNGGRRRRGGIRLHRSRTLSAAQVTLRRGIPVTTPARTLVDLPRVAASSDVRRARRQAELGRLLDRRAEVPSDLETAGTRSDLELAFLRFCRRHRLPAPEVNVKLGVGLTADFLWRSSKLVVETDDERYHRGRVAFEDDHLRDLRLRRLGYAVHRYTGAQLSGFTAEIAAELGEILR